MIYALIRDSKVQNMIVVDDLSFISLIAHEWEFCKRVDNREQVPHIGWTYNAATDSFSPPTEENNE
jgi:hypothetical protein